MAKLIIGAVMKRIAKPLILIAAFVVASAVISSLNHQKPTLPPVITPQQEEIQPQKISPSEAKAAITSQTLKKDVLKVCSFGSRSTGSPGNVAAAKFIKKTFEDAGLQVEYQEFPGNRKTSKNIIAYKEGKNKNEIIVVGAHMDDVGHQGAGADDNASGTAAVLEIAKAFSKLPKLSRTISFQCYSGEEQGLVGSRYYVNHPILPKDSPDIRKHVFMINLDMIGYSKEQVGNFPLGGGGSDHQSFQSKGVSSIFLHTGLHKYYHTAQDTPEKLNYGGMEKITRNAFDLALSKVQNGSTKEPRLIHKAIRDHDLAPFAEF
jgi:Zn-dependent M28 family amino/carboxypeptidase